jgi:hypothetical protein
MKNIYSHFVCFWNDACILVSSFQVFSETWNKKCGAHNLRALAGILSSSSSSVSPILHPTSHCDTCKVYSDFYFPYSTHFSLYTYSIEEWKMRMEQRTHPSIMRAVYRQTIIPWWESMSEEENKIIIILVVPMLIAILNGVNQGTFLSFYFIEMKSKIQYKYNSQFLSHLLWIQNVFDMTKLLIVSWYKSRRLQRLQRLYYRK